MGTVQRAVAAGRRTCRHVHCLLQQRAASDGGARDGCQRVVACANQTANGLAHRAATRAERWKRRTICDTTGATQREATREYAALVKDQAAQQKAVRKECDAKVADVEKYAETIKTKIRDLQAKSEQTEAPAPAANKQVKAVRASESIDDSSDDVGDLAKRQLVAQPDDDDDVFAEPLPDLPPSDHVDAPREPDEDDDDASSSRPEDLAGIDKAVQRTLRISILGDNDFDVDDIVQGHQSSSERTSRSSERSSERDSSHKHSTG